MANPKLQTLKVSFELGGGATIADDIKWLRNAPQATITFNTNATAVRTELEKAFVNVPVTFDLAPFTAQLESAVTAAFQGAIAAATSQISTLASQLRAAAGAGGGNTPGRGGGGGGRGRGRGRSGGGGGGGDDEDEEPPPLPTYGQRRAVNYGGQRLEFDPVAGRFVDAEKLAARRSAANVALGQQRLKEEAAQARRAKEEEAAAQKAQKEAEKLANPGQSAETSLARKKEAELRSVVKAAEKANVPLSQLPQTAFIKEAQEFQAKEQATNKAQALADIQDKAPILAKGGLQNLRNAQTLQQIGFGAIFGATAGGPIGGVVGGVASAAGAVAGGAPGALLASTGLQAASVLINAFLEPVHAKEEEFKQAGETFAHSILSITAVLQNSYQQIDTSKGGIATQLKARESEAVNIQLAARAKILPLGVGGEAESTLVSSTVAGLSQRGLKGSAEQISTLSQRIAATIQAQQPQLLDNPARLRRDVEGVLNASGRPSSLTAILGREVTTGLRRGSNIEDLVKATDSLKGFVSAVSASDSTGALLAKRVGAEENVKLAGGVAYFEALKPALANFIEALSNPEVIKASASLGTGLGKIAGITLDLTSNFIKLSSAITNFTGQVLNTTGQVGKKATESGKNILQNIAAGLGQEDDFGISGFFKTVGAGFSSAGTGPSELGNLFGDFGASAKEIFGLTSSGLKETFGANPEDAEKKKDENAPTPPLRLRTEIDRILNEVGLSDKIATFALGTESPEAKLESLKAARAVAVRPDAESGLKDSVLPGIASTGIKLQQEATKTQIDYLKRLSGPGIADQIISAAKSGNAFIQSGVVDLKESIDQLTTPENADRLRADKGVLDRDSVEADLKQRASIEEARSLEEKNRVAQVNGQSLFGARQSNVVQLDTLSKKQADVAADISEQTRNLYEEGRTPGNAQVLLGVDKQKQAELGVQQQQLLSAGRQNDFDIASTQAEYNIKLRESSNLLSVEADKRRDLVSSISENRSALDGFADKLKADSASKEEQFVGLAKEANALGLNTRPFTAEEEEQVKKNSIKTRYNAVAREIGQREIGGPGELGLISSVSQFSQNEDNEKGKLEATARKLGQELDNLPDVLADGAAKVGRELDALATRLGAFADQGAKKAPTTPEGIAEANAASEKIEAGQSKIAENKKAFAAKLLPHKKSYEALTAQIKADQERKAKAGAPIHFTDDEFGVQPGGSYISPDTNVLGTPEANELSVPDLQPVFGPSATGNPLATGGAAGGTVTASGEERAQGSPAAVVRSQDELAKSLEALRQDIAGVKANGIKANIDSDQVAQFVSAGMKSAVNL